MRTTLPLLLVAGIAAPVLASEEWWPTTTKHWGFTETSDCDSTTEWAPPPTSVPYVPYTETEESTSYSTVTISITSCSGGCFKTSTLSSLVVPTSTSVYAAPSSSLYSAPGLSLTLGAPPAPPTSYPAPPAPPAPATTTYSSYSSIATYVPVNSSSTGVVRATPTLPLTANGAVTQSAWSFSAALVGAVGALFAML